MGLIAFPLVVFWGLRAEDEATVRQAELESMFRDIPPFPGGSSGSAYASHKLRHAFVNASFTTPAAWPDIRRHYDAELGKRGWHLVSEQHASPEDEPGSHETLHYSKGHIIAILEASRHQCTGDRAYSFGLIWWL